MATTQVTSKQEITRSPAIAQTYEWASQLWAKQQNYAPGVKLATSMHYGEQCKYVTWTFPASMGQIELIHLTDLQFGHIACREDRVDEYFDWVLDSPRRYVLLGGDIVDAWAMWSPGSPFEQNCNPQSQVYRIATKLGKIRHRILGSVGGNHERRAIPAFGDLGVLIATMLRIPYSSGQQFIDIKFGKHDPFKAHLWHGRGAARTKGAKLNMVHDFARSSDAQLVLCGHLHDVLMTVSWLVRRLPGGKIKLVKQYSAMSSSFLEHFGTYGEIAGFNPTEIMMARTILTPDGKYEMTFK